MGICDAPARAKVLNMSQHNGSFGCNYCKIYAPFNEDLKCRVFVPTSNLQPRTTDEWKKLALAASNTKITRANEREFLGVKGWNQLLRLPYIDIVSFCPPDYMHSQLLGTVRLLLAYWLGGRSQLFKYNFHMVWHLPQVVRQYGPLITNSAFQLENWMGKIAKQIHESKIHIAEQAINKCSVISSTITNFYSNIDCFETEFIKYF
ncbi:hypothetical protein RDWZM_009786 [Blomia tropicalis]|uniref:Uncharacterized protein n=1 Tax=Blomia tropicalis TaxID=40697 RepID=A0A9Q0M4A3_BLOTA|nr:hypothetical protein RDWZM_009786 [Blomia tropicalis]